MKFILSASTDVGTVKHTNQDSLYAKIVADGDDEMAFAIVCDGMGGLEKGEVASASVIHAYKNWSEERLPALYARGIPAGELSREWCDIARQCNDKIGIYGQKTGTEMGTTATVLLLTGKQYYIMNVGDTRAYEISDQIRLLTKDQTVVAREIEAGRLTEEMAEKDENRSVLLQCIGACDTVQPDIFIGDTKQDAVYMLCSDGFRHEISGDEILEGLDPNRMTSTESMKRQELALIDQVKRRKESDNISVITIRTYV